MTRPQASETPPTLASLTVALLNRLDDDRGARAELRRCHTTTEVMLTPTYHEFRRELVQAGYDVFSPRLAALVGVLAHVASHDDQERVGAQLAHGKRGGNASVSGLRFRRLLASQEPDDLYRSWLRAVRLVDGRVNVADLANRFAYWGDRARRELAQEYYDAAPNEH